MNYTQINEIIRGKLEAYLEYKVPKKEIAKKLNKHRTTIYREIKRNSVGKRYDSIIAQDLSDQRNSGKKDFSIYKYEKFIDYFENKFDRKLYSPDVLVNVAKKDKMFPKIPSTKTLYNWINYGAIRQVRRGSLLRFYKKKRISSKTIFQKKTKEHRVMIHLRPKYINNKEEYGHWEIDGIESTKKDKKMILSFIERKSKYQFYIPVESKNMKIVYNAIKEFIVKNKLNVKSITTDNGMEFNELYKLTKELNIKVYYCHPYAPSEKGIVENANSIFRRFFPKKTEFSNIEVNDFYKVNSLVNDMPRKILNYLTPNNFKEQIFHI